MLRHAFRQYFRILGICAGVGAGLAATSQQASAAQEFLLNADQSQVVRLPVPPATIVVGNPAIADVTTDGSSLLFHSRGFGVTNVFALDAKGKKLADYIVRVIFEDTYSVSLYEPGGRKSYTCRINCETVLRIGDNRAYFDDYAQEATTRFDLVTKQAAGGDTQSTPSATTITGASVGMPGN